MDDLFRALDEFTDEIPLSVLSDWIENSEILEDRIQSFIKFHPDHYLRNLMRRGPAYHALVLCWQPGQRSPIHDHLGSACAVRVIKGTATETMFSQTEDGFVYPTHSRFLNQGDTMASDSADIHQVSNLQPSGSPLITFHLYSPPLFTMNIYSLLDMSVSTFTDPVNQEFVSGAGI